MDFFGPTGRSWLVDTQHLFCFGAESSDNVDRFNGEGFMQIQFFRLIKSGPGLSFDDLRFLRFEGKLEVRHVLQV